MKISIFTAFLLSSVLIHSASADKRPEPSRGRHTVSVARPGSGRASAPRQRLGAPTQSSRVFAASPRNSRSFSPVGGLRQRGSGFNGDNTQPRAFTPRVYRSGGAAISKQPRTYLNPSNSGATRTLAGRHGGLGRGTGDGNLRGNGGGRGIADGRNRGDGNGGQDWRGRRGDGDGRDGDRRHHGGGDRDWDGDGRHHHWDRDHHHRDWWRSRYNRFALFCGGYYYWNLGYWYPAYGYDPYFSSYAYDAPIYGYNDREPGQVLSDVQAELARRGYYRGAVDGIYGQQTQEALLRFQQDSGLPTSGQIDEETLSALGYN